MSYSSLIGTLFSGPSVTSTSPPHNGLAVGPNNIVMVEGSRIEWTNLTGGSPTLQSTYNFFSSLSPTGGLYDQRCVYDSVNQRFVVIMQYAAAGATISNIDIAVSKDSNPDDGWYFTSLNTSLTINGQLTGSDRPMLSADGTNIYITAAQFNVNISGYVGTESWVIGDTAGPGGGIYNGGTLTVTANQLTPSNQGVFTVTAGSNGKTYYASDYSSGGQILLALQTYDKATSTFGAVSTISLGNIDQGGAYTVQQKGTSLLLDAVDNRIGNIVYANGFLYGVAEMKPIGSSVPQVHWFKIDVSNPDAPTLVAQGDISGTAIGANVATFNSSIAVDGTGDVIINFTASGPNNYPSDYYVFQGASDPTGSFSAPILYQASTGFFDSGNGASVQRWGLNSSTTVDPNNPNSFWLSNEYIANGWWQTSVARVAIQNIAATAPTVTSIVASGTGITSGTGDLNTGKVVTLTVNFSAAVTVNTTGGTPTLILNDGGTATYTAGSGTSALTFSYTVAPGQNTPDLIISSLSPNGATMKDATGNDANLTGAANYNPAGTLQIDTIAPVPVFSQEPSQVTSSSTAFFAFGTSNNETNGATYAYKLDGAIIWSPVNGNTLTLSGLANGSHTIQIQATDGAGNVSGAASYNWTISQAATAPPDHIVVVFEENHNYSQIVGNSAAPYINSLAAQGTLFTNFYAITHPSQPNYFATFTGSTQGVADDATHFFPTTTTLGGELQQTGKSFIGYGETGTGQEHSPWLSFGDSQGMGQNFSQFPTDFSQLPTVSFVSPSNLDNMHDGTIAQGDQWLNTNLGAYANWAKTHNSLLIVTFDEDDGTAANHIPTFVFGAGAGAGLSYQYENLYGLLHTIENMYGLPALGPSASTPPMSLAPATAATGSSQVTTSFSGISVTSSYPPQNGLAVGPNNVVTMEGSRIEWTNLTGGSPTLQSVYNFFSPLGATAANSLNHPRCVYDSVNQRYIVVMDNSASGHTVSNIDIAVSKDSNPNDGWYFASLNTSLTINGQLTSADSPTVSVDGTNIYITATQYNVNVSGSAGTECWVIGDTAGAGGGIYNGGTLTVTANQITPSAQGIFTVVAGNNGKTYYASDYSSGSQVVVTLQTYDSATNTFGPASTLSLGNIDQGGAYTAQQLGTSLLLDAGDKRTRNLAYANGFLYGVTEIKPIGSSAPAVHWFKIDVGNPNAPTLVAEGDISGAAIGTNVATFNPSIAVDGAGDVIINFTASGPNMYPGDYYVYQRGSDPPGSFSAPALYQASTGFFNSGNGASVQPWGNYSSATADPNTPNSFWISNQYVANNWWQTSVAKVAIQNPVATAPTVSSIATSGTGIANGSGDLAAGQVVTLTVNFSAAVTVNTAGGMPTLTLNDGGTATYIVGSGTTALTFSYTVAAGQNSPDLVVSSFNLNGATVKDGAGNVADLSAATNYNPIGTLQVDTIASTVSSIVASGPGITNGSGNLGTGQVVTLTVNMSEAVTINTAGGTPTLTLNDGGIATYTGGSGTTALTFSYTVAAGQNTPDLVVSSFNLNGATAKDGAGNVADLSAATNYNPIGTLQVDTIASTVSSIVASGPGITNGSGNLGTGQVVTLTVNMSEAVTINTTGGTPTLTLNDGGIATYTGGSGTTALTFSYTVAAGQNTPDLVVSSFNLNGATAKDGAGNVADLSGATNSNPAGTLQISTTALTVSSIATSGTGIANGSGDLAAGQVVTLTVNFSAAVTVNTTGGTPTLALNDGGIATYTGGSGTTALTFSYTVAAGQNTPDLIVSSFNLNGATVKDGAGNVADLSGATNYNPIGTLQVDTIASTVSSIVTSGPGITNGSGNLGTGQVVTLTVNMSEAVTINAASGTPTLTLNDGGIATYTGGSGTTALTFSYTVATGQNTPDLVVSSFSLNGATVKDGAGNAADLSAATNYNPAGTLQISTTALTVSSIATSGTGITNGSGDLNASQVVTLTVNFSAAVTVNTTGGTPTLTLNDGGSATYIGGSDTTALTFSYTVATGQNIADLIVSSFSLNGATVQDVGGNNASLAGATNYNPAGTLQIDTIVPVAAFSQEPPPVTGSSTAVFAFTTSNTETNGVSYAYKLDGATTWTAVAGSTLSLSGLANGSHAIQVQATDGAGNISGSPASYNWTIASAVAQIETQFSGISVTSSYPPNNGLAVGPSNVVMMEGSRIEWTNLAGGSPTLQSVYSFFSPLGSTAASSLNHPRAVYDSVNQRYIVVMDNSASGHTVSNIDIAVSKDSNPNDGWYFASLNTSLTINGQLTSADSPTVSVDGTNIYITATQYNVNVAGTAGTESWVIGDTAGAGGGIYKGGTLTVVANQLLPSNQNIFKLVAGNNGKTYYASTYSPGGSQVVVTLETYDAATNTFGPSSTLSLGNIDQGGAYTAQQLGTSLLLDASDKRTRNLAYANGFLYGVTEIRPIGSSVPLVHWFKIDVSNPNAPTLVAQGDISGAAIGTNVATFNPSIAVDAAGDVIINFTASGPSMYPGDYYVYQRGTDPPGSFSAPALYQASTGFFNSGNGASVQPWGNYSTATVDPNNPNSFWISNEYVANNWWQTSVAKIAIETAETPALTITNTSLNVTAGGSVPLGITATPVDSDDTISVKIDGVPTYETVTAPSGVTVASGLQADGTNTWTITESASTTGAPLTALTLSSSYTGSDHPVATFTVTASNMTSGETATSAAQTMTVTDPPAMTSNGGPSASPNGGAVASTPGSGQIDRLVALMDQFTAAGFHEVRTGAGAIISMFGPNGSHEDLAFLATPHHHHA